MLREDQGDLGIGEYLQPIEKSHHFSLEFALFFSFLCTKSQPIAVKLCL
jgi:hypothetical protein